MVWAIGCTTVGPAGGVGGFGVSTGGLGVSTGGFGSPVPASGFLGSPPLSGFFGSPPSGCGQANGLAGGSGSFTTLATACFTGSAADVQGRMMKK